MIVFIGFLDTRSKKKMRLIRFLGFCFGKGLYGMLFSKIRDVRVEVRLGKGEGN